MSIDDEIRYRCPKHRCGIQNEDSVLRCEQGCEYSIVANIPRFVPSENYSAAFGDQWKRYRKTQLDSYTNVPISENRLRRCVGEEVWANLEGKQVLEAGCGAGRFTEILLKKGCVVTSIDLSDAVEANQENFPQDKNHRIAQSDVLKLPFEEHQFDLVLCLGVIQHTPGTEETITALCNQVKSGGWLVIDHYTYSFGYYTRTAPIVRQIMKRLPRGKTIKITERMVGALLPLHKLVRNFRPAQSLLSRVSPLVCYYHGLPELNDELQKEWALLDTHDSLTDHFKRFRTRTQIQAHLRSLGIKNIWCEYGGNGVEARGQRFD